VTVLVPPAVPLPAETGKLRAEVRGFIAGELAAGRFTPLSTTRLWAWRDEAGSQAEWADELGRDVLAGGGLWPIIIEDG